MATNDFGQDSSNDSNDGGEIAAHPVQKTQLSCPSPTLFDPEWPPPLPTNLSTAANSAADQNWHINAEDFLLSVTRDELTLPQSPDYQSGMSIRPSSLPSGSHSYKMRVRPQRRRRWPSILVESNGRRLRTAASTCNIEMLTQILEDGCDPNASDEYKRSPLHLAACRGYVQIVQRLLQCGANPNVVDSLGNTPLHLAIVSASSNNFNVVVQELLKGGANVQMTDRSGKTPLDLAESKLRLLRSRYNTSTPESQKILADMCELTNLILLYVVNRNLFGDELATLEKQLKNLSTSDESSAQGTLVSQTADTLLASVERLTLGK